MQETLTAITGILVLASLSEAIVEYLFAPIVDVGPHDEPIPPGGNGRLNWRVLILRYLSVFIGVSLCIIYQVDLLTFFGLASPWPWVGYLVTGILIGRGSNFVHDFASRWLTKPNAL